MVWPSSVAFIASTTSSIPPAATRATQAVDGEILGPHAVERRQPPAEHVIAAGEQPRAVERPQVGDFLDHAQQRVVAARVGADARTGRGVSTLPQVEQVDERSRDALQRGEQRLERGLAPLHQMQHRAPRRARAEPGQPRQRAATAPRSLGLPWHRDIGELACAAQARSHRRDAHADHLHGNARTSRCRRSMRWSRRGMRSPPSIASRRARPGAARRCSRPPVQRAAEALGIASAPPASLKRRGGAGGVRRARRRCRGGRGLWADPAAADPRRAAARLPQRPRLAAAALARRGADPARDPGRRRRDRRDHHADGGRARHRADAGERESADRATRMPANSRTNLREIGARLMVEVLASLDRFKPIAAARGRRHLRRQDRQGRGADRLVARRAERRAPGPRLRALPRRLVRARRASGSSCSRLRRSRATARQAKCSTTA